MGCINIAYYTKKKFFGLRPMTDKELIEKYGKIPTVPNPPGGQENQLSQKILKHGKYYYNTMNIYCEECDCLYKIEEKDIKVYNKPKKVTILGWKDYTWKEKRYYYTLCPECNNDNPLTDDEYYTITKKVKES